jgi:hypothetical protein
MLLPSCSEMRNKATVAAADDYPELKRGGAAQLMPKDTT